MRQRLLQHLSFAKPLRLALVLSTLLLTLPQTAWGDDSTIYNFTGTSDISNKTGTATSKVAGTEGYNWSIKDFSITNDQNVIQDITPTAIAGTLGYFNLGYSSYTADLTIESDFGITGCFVSATINYTTSDMSSGEVQVYNTKSNSPLALGTGNANKITMDLAQSTVTLNLNPTYNNEKVFNDNHISFQFTFKPNSASSSFQITSITITTTPISYGISVAGTPVTNGNASGITGTGISGTVKYTHNNDGTGTLTLNGATLTNKIRISRAEALTIELIGENSIQSDSSAIKADFGTTQTPPTPNLIFKGEGYVTLTPGSSYPAIGGFNVDITTNGMYAHGSLTTNGTSGIIAKKYDITVAGVPVTSFNATTGIAAGNGKVYYDATNNILTLDGAEVVGMIKTELENLTIKLKGNNNTITTNNSNNGIYSEKNTGTLTFTKEGANASLTIASNVSVIRGFASLGLENSGLYTKTSTPYKIKSDSSYPRLADATTSDADTTAIKSITISDVATYQLWVAGNQATYSNASNVTGAQTPTVAFNATDNILTLNGFSVNAPIFSNLDNLTILFQGDNNLGNNSSGASGYISSLNTNAPLILKGGTGNCTLVLDDDYGHAVISGFVSVTFDGSYLTSNNSCGYATGTDAAIRDVKGGIVQSATITTTPHYPLWVSSTQVTPTNNTDVLRNATVSFDYDSRTLTLNGTSINNSNAIESWLDKLIINLKGNNSVSTYVNGYSAICSGIETATLTIAKDATATGDVQLSLNTGGNPLPPIIKGFKSVDYNGLNFVSKTGTTPNGTTTTDGIFSSGTIYPLWIGGVWVTDANNSFNGTTSGTLVYDGSSNTITMTDYVSTFTTGHAIETGIDGLKVKLIGGNNAITCNDANGYAFYNGSGNTDASIQFVKDNTTSKLTLQTTPTDPFGGFANGSITYNELVYYPTGKYIAIPTAPTMTEDNDKVKLDRDNYEGGTIAIKYSIAYADGKTADVTDATYSAPFEMAAPGTVTAWVEANGATTSTVKGKKFGYQGAPLSMMVNEELTPVLIPSIESGDGIDYSTTTAAYESSDTNIATFANKKINSVAIGTVTLTTRLATNNNTIALLNHNGEFTTQLTVSKVFNVTFAEGANYMIYYNSAHDNLTIPDGMTAAIVTGVSSSGTTVETTTLSYIPETTAVLLGKGTSTGTPTLTLFTGTLENTTANKLKYVDNTPVATTGYEYVLYKDEFVKATGSIPDGKCYLDLTGAAPAPARSLGIDSDGTTDIRELRMENEERDEWYDLQGRRIEQPTKAGLYIKNGKKVIVNTK